jgi:hypothetical protein
MSSSDLRRKSGTFASAAGYPAGIAELTGTATRAAGGARGVVREAERGRDYLHAGTEYARRRAVVAAAVVFVLLLLPALFVQFVGHGGAIGGR